MAVLEKIRVRMGVFITVIIGIALISFIVDVDTLRSVSSMFSSKYDVGEIKGKGISYTTFQKKIDYYTGIHQLLSGGATLTEPQQEQVRESAWSDFFKEGVLTPEFDKCGLSVSDEEMLDLAQGRNISPILLQDPVFADETTGQFSRAKVVNIIKNMANDPSGQTEAYWNYCETRMHDMQLIEKYASLVVQSQYTNSLEMKRRVADHNTTAAISYVVKPIGFVADSTIKVSESEAKAYYKKHEKEYEQEASRDIEYVSFLIAPSDDDIQLAEEQINSIYGEFEKVKNEDLRMFVNRNSDKPFDEFYYKEGELSSKLDSFAFSKNPTILPVYKDENIFYAARVADVKTLPDSVRARHILVQAPSKELAHQLADSLMTVLSKGADFAITAQQYSVDANANRQGGDLGWFTQGRMVKAFETAAFEAPLNKYQKVETDYGVHIFEVTGRTKPMKKVQLATIQREAVAGKITYQGVFAQANELATESKNDYHTFAQISGVKNLMKVPAYGLREGDKTIAGFQNARELVRWAYDAETETGNVSSVMNIDNSYFVVASLVAVRKDGIAPFAQVRGDIETLLRREKQGEKIAQEIQAVQAGVSNLESLAGKLNLTVQNASEISFTSAMIPGIGYDFKLLGAVAGAKEQTLTGPVKGMTGVYVFTLDNRQVGSSYTADDEKMRQRYMMMQGGMYDFVRVLQKAADVKDWRGRFF